MSEVLLTGERLQPGSQLFGVDLARHRAAYVYANLNARGDRLLDLGCGTGYGTAELADSVTTKIGIFGLDRVQPASSSRRQNANFLRADLGGPDPNVVEGSGSGILARIHRFSHAMRATPTPCA